MYISLTIAIAMNMIWSIWMAFKYVSLELRVNALEAEQQMFTAARIAASQPAGREPYGL